MATIRVEVPDEAMPYLDALATVRGVAVADLVAQGLRHLRVTQTERQRVAFYRYVQQTGSEYARPDLR